MATANWKFTTAIGAERRGNLEAAMSFEAIAREMAATMTVLCCHNDPCDRGPGTTGVSGGTVPAFRRPVYCVSVGRPLFDQFFNSWHGYRAAYFLSPFEGLAANDLLLRTLAPALIASAPPGDGAALGSEFIKESLTSVSAKAWLTEQNHFCELCKGEWTSDQQAAEIINGRWEHDDTSNARNGRAAPYLTKIKVMGAFLNDAHDEFIPERKRRRHWDIHRWGWS
jgi:hypothetical protein